MVYCIAQNLVDLAVHLLCKAANLSIFFAKMFWVAICHSFYHRFLLLYGTSAFFGHTQ